MRKLLLSLVLLIFSIGANAQFSNGQVLTAQALNAALAAPTITGGSINGSPIGQSVPSNGTFVNLTVNGTFTAAMGTISLSGLAAQAANTVVGNATGSSASPTALAMPSCSASGNNLQWTSGTGFTCATGYALTTNPLSQFASTTSAQLAGIISDETGSGGSLVFATSPTISSPSISNPTFSGTVTLPAASVSLSSLATEAANTVVANASSATASPTAFAMPSCSGTSSALAWTTNTGFNCNTTVNAATLGGATFASPGAIGGTTTGSGAFTTLSASSTVSGTGFSTYLASPPAIGGTVAAAGSFTTLSSTGNFTPSQTNGIVGTTTNNNANAGSVGEYITNNASGVSMPIAGTVTNITSISLTAGDWDVWGACQVTSSANVLSNADVGISTTSATLPAQGQYSQIATTSGIFIVLSQVAPITRLSLSGTTTVFLVSGGVSASGTNTGVGYIAARRTR